MTRKELANIRSSKVRKDAALFSLFKTFITEDAGHIFSSGKLPAGCFGCSFANYFQRWSDYVLRDEPKIIVKMESSITYKLARPGYRVYFKGAVLGDKSTDAEWIDWITYAKGDQQQERKDKFKVLPEALRPEKKVESTENKPSVGREEIQQAPAQTPGKTVPKRGRKSKKGSGARQGSPR